MNRGKRLMLYGPYDHIAAEQDGVLMQCKVCTYPERRLHSGSGCDLSCPGTSAAAQSRWHQAPIAPHLLLPPAPLWPAPMADAFTAQHSSVRSHNTLRAACSRGERYDWTDDEIWNIITNDGKSVDPFVMLHAPTFQTLNPLCMPDWASQGIEYVDDMEDWISQEGRWMSQAEYASVEAADGSGEDDDEDFMAVRLHICAQLLHDSYGMGHITPTTA